MRHLLGAALLILASAGSAFASTVVTPPTPTQFTFLGVCAATDPCSAGTGEGNGTLTVQNYTLGQEFTNANFVDFVYHSSVFSTTPFEITAADLGDFSGSIGPVLPAPQNVMITNNVPFGNEGYSLFMSFDSGGWCLGTAPYACAADLGPTHLWSLTATATPEPMSVALLGVGLLGFAAAKRRRTAGQ